MSEFPLAFAQKPTMSSLEIAKLCDKQHKNVLADIKKILLEAEIQPAEFSADYKDDKGRTYQCFYLPRRECDLIIAGYSVKYRLAIIDRWQELENQQAQKLPQTYSAALRQLADETEAKERALLQISHDQPKVEFALAVRNLDGSCLVREFAKVIGWGQNKLYAKLRECGFLMANNEPYQVYVDRGIFVRVENTPFTDSSGKSHPSFTTRITGKGQVFLEKKLRGEVKEEVAA